MATRKRNKSNGTNGTAAERTRRVKACIAEAIGRARRKAFNEAANIAAKEHPNGWGFYRWFAEAWGKATPRFDRKEVRS